MLQTIFRHKWYYASLATIITLGLFLSYQTSSKELQVAVVVLLSVFYVFYGIFHHFLEHDISQKIVIEYVLMGTLGLAIVFFLLKGGLGG